MSTERFPIDYNPSKMLYLASLGYGNPKISVIFVYRETEKMYMVIPDATRDLIGLYVMISGLSRIKKNRVHAFETLEGALDWLWKAAVAHELDLKKRYDDMAELVEQIGVCLDVERRKPGQVESLLAKEIRG